MTKNEYKLLPRVIWLPIEEVFKVKSARIVKPVILYRLLIIIPGRDKSLPTLRKVRR